jgi:nickel-dependent lactate racemase
MPVTIDYAKTRLTLSIDPARLIGQLHGPPALPNPAEATAHALEAPLGFPPLRRALTPDDHVVVLIDDPSPLVGTVLPAVLEHITSAGVQPTAITLLSPPGVDSAAWIDQLPDEFDDVHMETHDPKNKNQLAYLATTQAGRRLYLNRSLVDADQSVVLTTRRYDALFGYAGAETALFPALSDELTRQALLGPFYEEPPGPTPWPLRAEAMEVAWLLGQPFYVQLLASAGDGLSHIVAGVSDAARAAERLLDSCWRTHPTRRADTVVASLSGQPSEQGFTDLAAALSCATRIVRPGGRVILLSGLEGDLGDGLEFIRHADDPQAALAKLANGEITVSAAVQQWLRGVAHAHVSLLSGLPEQLVEDLFATPLVSSQQVQRLLDQGGDCLIVRDAQRMISLVE